MGPFKFLIVNRGLPVDANRHCQIGNHQTCGPEGIRTPDLLSAIEARSQLRYRPTFTRQGWFMGDGYST
jgi:hypothetical protein